MKSNVISRRCWKTKASPLIYHPKILYTKQTVAEFQTLRTKGHLEKWIALVRDILLTKQGPTVYNAMGVFLSTDIYCNSVAEVEKSYMLDIINQYKAYGKIPNNPTASLFF